MKQLLAGILVLFSLYCIPFRYTDINSCKKDVIHVAVEGEVQNSVVLELPVNSTIEDALTHVQFTEDADITALNLNTILIDGDVIVVSIKENHKVSINNATMEELTTIKGIGESRALRIIQYRQEHGRFQTLEELMNIKGIKQKLFDKIKDFITL
ncbi:MAG: helix-hairpin-helix domain-containing protein [Erysipelotrichaceae bacterium]|nr:helix-hairpin-helix domain-containing protein [Erysipelotrichaceae bacterium]